MVLRTRFEEADASKSGEQSLAIRLMEHLVVPTFVIDNNHRVVVWNKACERLTKVAASDVLGTSNHWTAFFSTFQPCLADLVATGRYADIEQYYKGWDNYGLTDFGVSIEAEYNMPRLNRKLHLAIDAGPIYDDHGNLVAVIESLRDITAHIEAQNTLQDLATRDGLTDLLNRRSFDRTLAAELRTCSREGKPLALLMIDVDFFKRYNDHFGHMGGDECLKVVTRAIGGVLRTGDTAARYGGEEFAVILPGLTCGDAEAVAERIRGSIQDLGLAHPKSPFKVVTLSIGIGSGAASDLVPGDLVAAADEALYGSKRQGRNRVSFTEARSSSVILF